MVELAEGEDSRIAYIKGDHRILQRLLDLGLTPHTKVTLERIGPIGGPVQVVVRNSRLALGREIARNIFVDTIDRS